MFLFSTIMVHEGSKQGKWISKGRQGRSSNRKAAYLYVHCMHQETLHCPVKLSWTKITCMLKKNCKCMTMKASIKLMNLISEEKVWWHTVSSGCSLMRNFRRLKHSLRIFAQENELIFFMLPWQTKIPEWATARSRGTPSWSYNTHAPSSTLAPSSLIFVGHLSC